MKTENTTPGVSRQGVWEDIIDDLLEISASVGEEGRCYLREKLRVHGIITEKIDLCTSFSISDVLVTVCSRDELREFWVFHPRIKKIQRLRPCT
ncbi:MAG: hypothetical protein A2Z83_01060 [Omnitrophica bacterium GWA2_52_8]|nr:MAG: hypothetical protein A2Z83_01060 [Omnitrophica bacterium GWA2_52_8]